MTLNWTTTKIVGDNMKEGLFFGASVLINQSIAPLEDGRKVWDVTGVTDFSGVFRDLTNV